MLEVTKVTKKFGELTAVNDLSFTVSGGQIFGIAGPNGAGKSTLYNLITGLYPFEGSIAFQGRELTGLPPHKIAQMGIARSFQTPQTFSSLTVRQSLEVGNIFGAQDGPDHDYIDMLLDFVDLTREQHSMTDKLNLLGKKKLMTGAALATKPHILMLDEPMAGSNPKEITQLMELIAAINEKLGVTIIIIEHFMKVLTELAAELLIIETGTAICCGEPAAMISDPRVIECYLGESNA